ncbi:MAG: thioredoxin domain-containing protein [Blastocatellia bacterium]
MKAVSRLLFIVVFALVCNVATGLSQQKPQPSKPVGPLQPPAPQEKKEEDCGCEAKIPSDTAAVVNGVKIMMKDVDEPVNTKIKDLQNQVVEARKRQVNLMINAKLLEAEAKKRGISADRILEMEVVSKVKEPTEAEAQTFFQQNRDKIQGEFNDVKAQIIAYIRNERQAQEAKKLADRLRATSPVKVMTENPTPPQTTADRARVFATVNGTSITSGDVEDALQPIIFDSQEQVYTLRKQSLDARLNDMLLDQESKKRNMTPRAVYEAEVIAKVKPVTEEESRKLYDDNKEKLSGTYEQLKPQILQYIQGQQQQKAEAEFADQLRKAATVLMILREPDPPVLAISTDDQPAKGSPTAPVTIIEFTDYQCPSCAKSQPIIEEVAKEYGDKVRLVARDFPLEQHTFAAKAAEAAEAAREQGKYWEYVAVLFKNQTALEVVKLKEYATQVGLDRTKFDQALDSGKFADKVQRDLREGDKLGVNSTPTVFINGKRIRDKTPEGLKAAIEAALKTGSSK